MQVLARLELVRGTRGVGGGYRFNKVPDDITLYDLAVHLGDRERLHDRCFLGKEACDEDDPCALHLYWQERRQDIIEFMEKMPLAKVIENQRVIRV